MRLLVAIFIFTLSVFGAAPTIVPFTIQESGGDFTSLKNFEDAIDGDLTSTNVIIEARIQGSWTNPDPDGAVTITGWTTSSTCYLCITNSTSKHDGKRYASPSTCYRIEATDVPCINFYEEYCRFYGLSLKVTATSSTRRCIAFSATATSTVYIGNCIFTGTASGTSVIYAFDATDADTTAYAFNCLFYGFINGTTACRSVAVSSATVTLYNCTSFGSYVGYREASGTLSTSNCIAQDTDGWSGTIDGDYNCSLNGDAPGANSLAGNVDVTFVSESAGGEDFHIDSSDASGVKDATSDQSSGLFADDIDYVTRTGSWDIGADEYVAAGGVNPQVIIIRQN